MHICSVHEIQLFFFLKFTEFNREIGISIKLNDLQSYNLLQLMIIEPIKRSGM